MFSPLFTPWFAVQVVPRSEAKVAICLERKGYQSFLPTHEVRRKWSDRFKTLHLPLFPGYVFCRSERQAAGLILATPHVVRIVGCGGKPSSIEDYDIDALRRIESSAVASEPCSYLRIGDPVQIKEGPLSGIRGILVQIKNQRRLVISVDAIMKSVSVDVGAIEMCPGPRTFAATAYGAQTKHQNTVYSFTTPNATITAQKRSAPTKTIRGAVKWSNSAQPAADDAAAAASGCSLAP